MNLKPQQVTNKRGTTIVIKFCQINVITEFKMAGSSYDENTSDNKESRILGGYDKMFSTFRVTKLTNVHVLRSSILYINLWYVHVPRYVRVCSGYMHIPSSVQSVLESAGMF